MNARALGVAIWLVTLFFSLAAFGSLLRATTHNHALAGAMVAEAKKAGVVLATGSRVERLDREGGGWRVAN